MEPASTSDSNRNGKGIALNKDGSNHNSVNLHLTILCEVAINQLYGKNINRRKKSFSSCRHRLRSSRVDQIEIRSAGDVVDAALARR
jgi:hypothetical protein